MKHLLIFLALTIAVSCTKSNDSAETTQPVEVRVTPPCGCADLQIKKGNVALSDTCYRGQYPIGKLRAK